MIHSYRFLISIIIVIVAYIYCPISVLNFSSPDDNWMLLSNRFIEMDNFFTTANILKVFQTFESGQYSPLNTVYYRLIYHIQGLDPYYFHIFSWLIHLCNITAVFQLCRRILLFFDLDEKQLPVIVSLIWAIHPLNVESVIWISASKIPLFTLFVLISTINVFDALLKKKGRFLLYSFIFFVIACLCKEQAFMNVFVILFLLGYHIRKCGYVTDRWPVYLYILSSVSTTLIFAILSRNANAAHTNQLVIQSYSILERLTLIGHCLFFYIKNTVLPFGLHFHYGMPFLKGSDIWMELTLYVIFFIFLSMLVFYYLKRSKIPSFYLFNLLGFFAHLGLVLQVIPMTRTSAVADRYMYLPILYLIIPGVYYLLQLLKHQSALNIKFAQSAFALYSLYLIIYGHFLSEKWALLNI